jgi:hypothetical protein
MIDGIDVSLWQDDITHALIGQRFCINKVSQAGFGDPKRVKHLAQSKAAGVVVGAYHWLDPAPSAIVQAKNFLSKADPAEFLALDVEGRILRNMPVAEKMAGDFIAYVHANDPKRRKIGLYSSRGTWPWNHSHGEDFRWVADYVADPNRLGVHPRVGWTFWQHAGGHLDRNYFGGTLAELYALANRLPDPAPGDDPMTNLVPLTAHRVVNLAAGVVLFKTPGGDVFTHLTAPVRLGLFGATPTHYHVADGDNGVYVKRTDATVATADINVGS